MKQKFCFDNGFWIFWSTKTTGVCKVFSTNEDQINFLFSLLKHQQGKTVFKKYQSINGVLKQIA